MRRGKGLKLLSFPENFVSYCSGTFCFLNKCSPFTSWEESTYGKLWGYNLNYFDCLLQPGISEEEAFALIGDYIGQLRSDAMGMESYPISLRCMNWIKYFSRGPSPDEAVDSALYWQCEQLLANLEYHLMGNHLLENGFALLFGAYYFREERFYTVAQRILSEELEEQLLADGAHFELSPMYHRILLGRVLDSVNLIANNPWKTDALETSLYTAAHAMLGWMRAMAFSDGSFPLFNDSSHGIAPSSKALLSYAERLGMVSEVPELGASGYRRRVTGTYELIVDIGNIAADYVPGHTHNDFGNFELFSGIPLIIDTGVSTYEVSDRRQYERQTSAHNTVAVAPAEQNELWQSFRVARRGKARIVNETPELIVASLTYPDGTIVHERSFECLEREVVITDRISAPMQVEAYLHFHPNVALEETNEGILLDGRCRITVDGVEQMRLEDCEVAMGFNLLVHSKALVVRFRETLVTRVTF